MTGMREKASAVLPYAVVVLLAVLLLGTSLLDMPQINDWVFRASLLIILSVSWNLMANAGLISLGHSAFWGIGSYTAIVIANEAGLPLIAGILGAAAMGGLVGAGLAMATGRLRGIFFAISTLALSEGLRVVAIMLPDVTGGAMGLYLQPAVRGSRPLLLFLSVLTMIVSVIITALLARTRFHYACRAMRNNERAAEMLGLDPRRYRMTILAISAAMAAAAGALSSWYGGYLDPDVAFNLHITIEAQIAPIIGGLYSVAGPVLGGILVYTLSEITRIGLGAQEGVSQLVYGCLLVLAILFMPRGIYGLWARLCWRKRFAENLAASNRADEALP
jgi:branched-chain amino acid transport system permease protein